MRLDVLISSWTFLQDIFRKEIGTKLTSKVVVVLLPPFLVRSLYSVANLLNFSCSRSDIPSTDWKYFWSFLQTLFDTSLLWIESVVILLLFLYNWLLSVCIIITKSVLFCWWNCWTNISLWWSIDSYVIWMLTEKKVWCWDLRYNFIPSPRKDDNCVAILK